MLIRVCALLLVLALPARASQDESPLVEVFMPRVCLSCIEWADHLIKAGFRVNMVPTENMTRLKRWLNVPSDVESTMTSRVAGYLIEGHVPAEDIRLLLAEKPRARGLAVPGLPMGAPGREATGADGSCESGCTILEGGEIRRIPRREAYNTLLIGLDGKTRVFARH